MGLAQDLDIPEKEISENKWTVRSLFSLGAVTSTLSKTFLNVFDVLLGFCILVLGISEMIGRDVSWLFYVLTLFLFLASFTERAGEFDLDDKKPEHDND